MDGTPALICIPDITGFTEFMSEAKLESSRKIIPTLLNEIIYANTIDLKVSEIEGDAILFFRNGQPPALSKLLKQCQQFFKDFHGKLDEFSKQNQQNEDFQDLTERLGLKIVVHYGTIGMAKVGTHLKLMGEEVIVAHRLLKNDIPFDEYVLITKALMDQYREDTNTIDEINQMVTYGSDQYKHIGKLPYYYISAIQLRSFHQKLME
ncbi:DUF2652 domain-containing protein [Fulvivirga sp. M361]|uniref:DUF2652 domain-containing protein n=1 Tax=Fulvivirga sp. M361 TaxID=2594266 RepID=UPI0016287784|nr:DUF2652 domain-containing protein [Fulvivirga sp. M361]